MIALDPGRVSQKTYILSRKFLKDTIVKDTLGNTSRDRLGTYVKMLRDMELLRQQIGKHLRFPETKDAKTRFFGELESFLDTMPKINDATFCETMTLTRQSY